MKRILYWTKDYLHMVRHGATMYFYAQSPTHYLGHIVKEKCPIIILPGILVRWAFLKPLADALSLEGHPVYIVPALGNNVFISKNPRGLCVRLLKSTPSKMRSLSPIAREVLLGKSCLNFIMVIYGS